MAFGLQETLSNNTVELYRTTIAHIYQSEYHINFRQIELTDKGLERNSIAFLNAREIDNT